MNLCQRCAISRVHNLGFAGRFLRFSGSVLAYINLRKQIRSDINQTVQPQNKVTNLKLWIYKEEELYCVAKNKGAYQQCFPIGKNPDFV